MRNGVQGGAGQLREGAGQEYSGFTTGRSTRGRPAGLAGGEKEESGVVKGEVADREADLQSRPNWRSCAVQNRHRQRPFSRTGKKRNKKWNLNTAITSAPRRPRRRD